MSAHQNINVPATTALKKGDGTGGFADALEGTDYVGPANAKLPASVIGLRFSTGAGSTDAAATANQVAAVLTGTTGTLNFGVAAVTLPARAYPEITSLTACTSIGTGASTFTFFPTASTAEKTLVAKDGTFGSVTTSNFNVNTGGGGFFIQPTSTYKGYYAASGLRLGSSDRVAFQADNTTGSIDLAIVRGAAGRADVTDGSGNYRDVALRSLIASGPCKLGVYTLSGLPAASAWTDSTATVTNPAAGKSYLVKSDGTNWRYQDQTIAV